MRGAARCDSELDDVQKAVDCRDVLVGDGCALTQRQEAKVGIGDVGGECQGDRALREAGGFESFACSTGVGALLTPDVELVTRGYAHTEGIGGGSGGLASPGLRGARGQALCLSLPADLGKKRRSLDDPARLSLLHPGGGYR